MKINEINEGSNPLFKINKFLDDKKKREEYARKLQQQRDAEDKEKVSEDFGSIPPLTDLIVMAVVGQTTVAALKAAYKTGKYALKLKRLADKAGVKLNNAVMGEQGVAESNPFTDARMNAIKAGKKEFTVNGKKYRVTGDTSDEEEAIANEGILDDIKTRYRMKSRIKDFELDREDNDKFGLQRPAQDRAERRLRKKLGKSVPSRLNPDQTQNEAVNRDEYAAKLAAQQKDKFFAAALAALDRLVKSDPRGQSVDGYAFDISRAFNGINGKELVAAYSATNESNLLELDIKTSKNHVKAAEYKNYFIYINKQKNNLGMFITIVMNGKNDIPALRAQAKKPEDAIAATKDKIDSIEEKAEKITSNATINLNVNFIREELPAATHYDTTDTFYAKLDVGPSLVIASEDWGDEATQLGFKKVAIKTTKSLEGVSTGGVFGMASGAVQSLNLIKHGRYTIGNMYRDDEGNYIFPLEYHSTAAAPNDPLKLGKPALGVNPRRE